MFSQLTALLPVLLAGQAAAHVALWHPSMYGFKLGDSQYNVAANPMNNLPFKDWWFHGNLGDPPQEGQFFDIPSGGVMEAELSCNKGLTSWGFFGKPKHRYERMACDGSRDTVESVGMEHTHDNYGTPIDQLRDVKGAAVAIAWQSDPYKLQPDDFVIVSINHSTPWYVDADYHIPAGLPPCPEGGCHCMWAWQHSEDGGGQEILQTIFRCKISGATGSVMPPKPYQVARKCPYDKNNCTIGAKVPFYWVQQERNNFFQDAIDPPYYNHEYGFEDGAQTDIWLTEEDRVAKSDGWVTDWALAPRGTTDAGVKLPAVTPATYTPSVGGPKPTPNAKVDIPDTNNLAAEAVGSAAPAATSAATDDTDDVAQCMRKRKRSRIAREH